MPCSRIELPPSGPPDDRFHRALMRQCSSARLAQSKSAGQIQSRHHRRGPWRDHRGARSGRAGREGGAHRARSHRRRSLECRLRAVESDHSHRAAVCGDARCGQFRRAGAGQHRHRLSSGDGADAAGPGAPQPGRLGTATESRRASMCISARRALRDPTLSRSPG